jgi:hypothetical protein
LAGIVQHRHEPFRCELLARTRHGPIEHHNLAWPRQRLTQSQRLVERRDKKPTATGYSERARDDRGTQPVTVGLDDCCTTGRGHAPGQEAPILDDARDIDFEHSTGAVGRIYTHGILIRPQRGLAGAMSSLSEECVSRDSAK